MRLIDANEAKKQVRKMQVLKASEKNLLALALDRTPTYEPSNAPLTLEELREMDGEPVWVVGGNDAYIDANGYGVVNFYECYPDRACIFWPGDEVEATPRVEDYGRTWLAYRRRPEEDRR